MKVRLRVQVPCIWAETANFLLLTVFIINLMFCNIDFENKNEIINTMNLHSYRNYICVCYIRFYKHVLGCCSFWQFEALDMVQIHEPFLLSPELNCTSPWTIQMSASRLRLVSKSIQNTVHVTIQRQVQHSQRSWSLVKTCAADIGNIGEHSWVLVLLNLPQMSVSYLSLVSYCNPNNLHVTWLLFL